MICGYCLGHIFFKVSQFLCQFNIDCVLNPSFDGQLTRQWSALIINQIHTTLRAPEGIFEFLSCRTVGQENLRMKPLS